MGKIIEFFVAYEYTFGIALSHRWNGQTFTILNEIFFVLGSNNRYFITS